MTDHQPIEQYPDLKARLPVLRMVWVVGLICAPILAWMYTQIQPPEAGAADPLIIYALTLAGIVFGLGSVGTRLHWLGPARVAPALAKCGKAEVGHFIYTRLVIVWSAAICAGLSGFGLALLGAPPVFVYGLIAYSMALVLAQPPSVRDVEKFLAAVEQEQLRSQT